MRKFCFLIVIIFFSNQISFTQSYGLCFNSHESLPEKRTALELVPNDSLFFSKDVRLDFDINLLPGQQTYFGYVVRIISNQQNIDIVYDEINSKFSLITDRNFSGISLALDSSAFFKNWCTLSILLQQSKQKLVLLANNKIIGSTNISLKDNYYKFLWGANDNKYYQTRDIPPMRIKDIKLFNGSELKYYWPLDEVVGNTSFDNIGQKKAVIKNPVWIKPAHENWSLLNSFTIKGNAVTAFDDKNETVYIAGSDSVFTYHIKNGLPTNQAYGVSLINLLPGSQAIFDTLTHKLLDVFIDEKKVIAYQPGQPQWNDVFSDPFETEYGHANKFLSKQDTSLYIIGGYGQLKYKNVVQRYSLSKNTWEIIKTKGDFFPPRYLAALGLNASGDTAFIVGGYGSPAGSQVLNPGNYSDLYAFDIKSKTFKKLLSLDTIFSKYTFANSLVIDSRNQVYYGLVFPNDSFNSNLQLVEGSLTKPVVKFLATKIPYSFYDAQSFADLYFAPLAEKLIAVTIFGLKYGENKNYSTAKIYTLDFPPDISVTVKPLSPSEKPNYILIVLSAAALSVIVYLVLKRHRKIQPTFIQEIAGVNTKGETELIKENNEELLPVYTELLSTRKQISEIRNKEPQKIHSAIFLFGQFQVVNKQGDDISELFTPVIKELFLLITVYTFRNGRGITSDELNEILWSGKSAKDATNNRSVNMTKLKPIVEKIGDCVLAKKSNYWQFQSAENAVFVDYEKFMQLVQNSNRVDKVYMQQLLQLTGKGAFLSQVEYGWLDNVKAEISNTFIDISLEYLNNSNDVYNDPEFVIEIANTIFYFDRLNEDALEYKCKGLVSLKRHTLANTTFNCFQKDYKEMYGEEFEKTFAEIIKPSTSQISGLPK